MAILLSILTSFLGVAVVALTGAVLYLWLVELPKREEACMKQDYAGEAYPDEDEDAKEFVHGDQRHIVGDEPPLPEEQTLPVLASSPDPAGPPPPEADEFDIDAGGGYIGYASEVDDDDYDAQMLEMRANREAQADVAPPGQQGAAALDLAGQIYNDSVRQQRDPYLIVQE